MSMNFNPIWTFVPSCFSLMPLPALSVTLSPSLTFAFAPSAVASASVSESSPRATPSSTFPDAFNCVMTASYTAFWSFVNSAATGDIPAVIKHPPRIAVMTASFSLLPFLPDEDSFPCPLAISEVTTQVFLTLLQTNL